MFYESFVGGSVKVILNKYSSSKVEGKYLVSIQVTWGRVPIRYSTKIYLSEEEFKQLPTTKLRQLSEIRKDISVLFDRMLGIAKQLMRDGTMSHAELKRLYAKNGSKVAVNTVSSLFDEKIQELNDDGKVSTAAYYESAKRKLESLGMGSVKIGSVDAGYIKKLDASMRESCSDTYIAMTMRALKHIINRAIIAKLINPRSPIFGRGGYEIIEVKGRKKALSKDTIASIIELEISQNQRRFYRDMWVFMYLANGMNCADLCHLKYSSIVGNELSFVRRKTRNTRRDHTEIRAYIHPIMERIIREWGNENKSSYLFPLLTGKEKTPNDFMNGENMAYKAINYHMNQIGEQLGIGRITTYVARHSFATVLKRSGASISYISEQLGHSNVDVTEHYLDSFESDTRKSNSMLLFDSKEDTDK